MDVPTRLHELQAQGDRQIGDSRAALLRSQFRQKKPKT
jgi:hypothetical protein